MFEITIEDKAKENGLAVMLYQMIKDNIDKNKWKERDAVLIRGTVSIYASDSDVKVGMVFKDGKCVVVDGDIYLPDIRIEARTMDLINLSRIKIVPPANLPVLDKESLELVKRILTKNIKIKFKLSLRNLLNLFLLVRLLSVYP